MKPATVPPGRSRSTTPPAASPTGARLTGEIDNASTRPGCAWPRRRRGDRTSSPRRPRWRADRPTTLRSRAGRRERPLDGVLDPISSRSIRTDPEHEALLGDSDGFVCCSHYHPPIRLSWRPGLDERFALVLNYTSGSVRRDRSRTSPLPCLPSGGAPTRQPRVAGACVAPTLPAPPSPTRDAGRGLHRGVARGPIQRWSRPSNSTGPRAPTPARRATRSCARRREDDRTVAPL